MKHPQKIALSLASMFVLGLALAGCGSGGEVEVDENALKARNSQRAAAGDGGGGAPPGATAGAPATGK